MYICLCNGVTDNQIKQSIHEGSMTMKALYQDTNLGNQCGKCCQCAKQILNNELLKISETQYQAA